MVVEHLHRLDAERAAEMHGEDDERALVLLEDVLLHLTKLTRLLDVHLTRDERDWPVWFPVVDAVDVVPVDLMRLRRHAEHRPLLIQQNHALHLGRVEHLRQEHTEVPEPTAQIHDVRTAFGGGRRRHRRHLVERVSDHRSALVEFLGQPTGFHDANPHGFRERGAPLLEHSDGGGENLGVIPRDAHRGELVGEPRDGVLPRHVGTRAREIRVVSLGGAAGDHRDAAVVGVRVRVDVRIGGRVVAATRCTPSATATATALFLAVALGFTLEVVALAAGGRAPGRRVSLGVGVGGRGRERGGGRRDVVRERETVHAFGDRGVGRRGVGRRGCRRVGGGGHGRPSARRRRRGRVVETLRLGERGRG